MLGTRKLLSSLNIRLLVLALVTVTPPFGVIVHATIEQRTKTVAEVQQRTLAMARHTVARQKDMLLQARTLLDGLVRSQAVAITSNMSACTALLGDLQEVLPVYENLFVTDDKGNIRCSATPLPHSINVADRSYFRRAMDTRAFSIGNVHRSRVSGADFIGLSQPIIDATGRVKAVVVASVRPSWINEALAGIELPEGASANLVDSAGQIVAHAPLRPELMGHAIADLPPLLVIARQRGEATSESVWLDGVTRIAGIVPMSDGGGDELYVQVGLSKAQAFAEVERAFQRDLTLLAVAAFLVLSLGWMASQRLVVNRVRDLARTARRLEAGDWSARTAQAPDEGELGELARIMDKTAENLQLRQARIEEVETQLRRSNRALRVLHGTTQALARAQDEPSLLRAVCQVMVDSGGYVMAWVGYAEDGEDKRVRPVAHAGDEDGYLASLKLSWAEQDSGRGPAGTAIRSGTPCIAKRIAQDPHFAPWREAALARGYASAIGLPLLGERVFGALTVMAAEADAFDAEEAKLLHEAAQELAFGIEVLRTGERSRQAETALHDSETRLAQILQSIDSVVWSATIDDRRISYINPAAERVYGRPVQEFYRSESLWLEAIHPDDRQEVSKGVARLMAEGCLNRRYRIVRPDGSVRWLDDRVRLRRGPSGGACQIDGVAIDITEQRLLEESLRLRDRAIEASHNGLLIAQLGQPPRITSVNPALLRMLGSEQSALLRQDLRVLARYGFASAGWKQLSELVRTQRGGKLSLELGASEEQQRCLDVSVAMVDDKGGHHSHAVIEFCDVTQSRRYQAQIERHANYDGLTGLPNRTLLANRLQQAVAHAARIGGVSTVVLWLSVDRFEAIVESLGRQVGDQVLVELARRLAALVEQHGTAARFEAGVFVLLVESMSSQEALVPLLDRLQQAVRQPLLVQEHELVATASIGIAVAPGDGRDVDTLLRNASVAMMRARECGQDCFRFYEEAMNAQAMPRLRMELALRQALERHELYVVYQPKADLQTGRMAGCEALVRWTHPEMGPVSPAEFIPIAEESGLIMSIGYWVMESVCAQLRRWLDEELDCPAVAVNVSALQFLRADLVGDVRRLLAQYRLPPRLLMIEITESILMADPARAVQMMGELRDTGIKLAIDDFGTGYSSLSTVSRFPLDYLKIDRSFVSDLPESEANVAIAGAVISLAHNLKLRVTAEGVETAAQMMFLRARGCHEMQGSYFCHPVAAEVVERMLRDDARVEFPE
jgi:diguanylate cyclase (GGDEF)-like protein/PAS domain S-box-containing protein